MTQSLEIKTMFIKPIANQPAMRSERRPEPIPQGIHHIDADAPASACQTPAFAGVKPLNTNSHNHVCIN
jgi:hypothetical protein